MAQPRVEDGHAKIANELVDALAKLNLTGHESRILWCIIRKTCGWNKERDRISYSQFQECTGIDRRHVGRSLASLKSRQIIVCRGEGYSLEYGLQTDYELWDKFATIPGINLPPSGATNTTEICHHSRADLPPSGDTLPPSEVSNLPPSGATTKAIKHLTKALDKSKSARTFGELLNVKLTPEEYEKLVAKLGAQEATFWIDELSLAKASKGYKTKSDYATILAWERRKQKGGASGADKRLPGSGPVRHTAEEARAALRERHG